MDKSFTVRQKENLFGEKKWCFCFGSDQTVTGVGKDNRRWWDSLKELTDELKALGIEKNVYVVFDDQGTQSNR